MKRFELVTNIIGYEKECKLIANIAKEYGVTEAIVLRSLLASSESNVFHSAINWYRDIDVNTTTHK